MNSEKGMSFVELLVVIVLATILVAIILPELHDIGTKSRDAETKNSLAILRHGIAHKAIQVQRECANKSFGFPSLKNVRANDITLDGIPCTEEEIPDPKDRYIFDSDLLPENYWGSPAISRRIFSCKPGKSCFVDGNPKAGIDCATSKAYSKNSGGWCYDEKEGLLWANSSSSQSEITENLY